MDDQETDLNENILPPRIAVPKRHSKTYKIVESEGSGNNRRGSEDVPRTERVGSGKRQIGLETLLEEIGVEDYPHRRNSRETVKEQRRISQESAKNAAGDYRRVSKEIVPVGRGFIPRPPRNPSHPDRPQSVDDVPDQFQRHTSVDSLLDYHRRPRERDPSIDSFSRKKEAIYDYDSERNDRQFHNQPRYPGGGKPSPGDGLRNALGNLETRLKRRTFGSSRESSANQQSEGSRRSSEVKGFATMVEELVKSRPHGGKGVFH